MLIAATNTDLLIQSFENCLKTILNEPTQFTESPPKLK